MQHVLAYTRLDTVLAYTRLDTVLAYTRLDTRRVAAPGLKSLRWPCAVLLGAFYNGELTSCRTRASLPVHFLWVRREFFQFLCGAPEDYHFIFLVLRLVSAPQENQTKTRMQR